MAEVTIQALDRGPYMVSGPAQVLDGAGNAFEAAGPIYLCRCGHSQKKPFCDGGHKGRFEDCSRARGVL